MITLKTRYPLTLCGRQPITLMVRCQANERSLVQPYSALRAELVLVLHQKTNPKQRKTKKKHQGEHNPPATTNLCHRVWRTVSAAVRTSVLGDVVAHKFAQFIRLLRARQYRKVELRAQLFR